MILDPMIHVVAKQADTRSALSQLVRKTSYPITESPDVETLVREYDATLPSCVIAHTSVEEYPFFEVHRTLAAKQVLSPVVLMTEVADVPSAVKAVKEGAFDVLVMPISIESLQNVLDYAIQTDCLRINHHKASANIKALLDTLTPRERQILRLVLEGKTTSQIAFELVRSEKTIKLHRAHLMKKMGTDSAMQLLQKILAACGTLDGI